ncbi:MAG: hypothetical protein HRU20_12320 [Pseudomonadales bacterium]|nr:hypothetical protein [Pseudomonadales bacterium]
MTLQKKFKHLGLIILALIVALTLFAAYEINTLSSVDTTAPIIKLFIALLLVITVTAMALFHLYKQINQGILSFKSQLESFAQDLNTGQHDFNKKIEIDSITELESLCLSFHAFTSLIEEKTHKVTHLSRENALTKLGLDNAATPALIVEDNGLVSYINRSMYEFIQVHAQDFSQYKNAFSDFPLLELCHQGQEFVDELIRATDPSLHKVTQGGLSVEWQVTPIIDEHNHISIHIIEWKDLTEKLQIQSEFEDMVSAAKQGDFSHTIDLSGKSGFYLTMAKDLNSIIKAVNDSLQDISTVLNDIAEGQLTKTIESNYAGMLGEVTGSMNHMVEHLKGIIEDISETVTAAKSGNYDSKINEQGKSGFYLQLSQAMNEQSRLIDSALSDLSQVMCSITEGDLSTQTKLPYEGKMKELSDYVDAMVYRLRGVMGLMSNLVENAAHGNLDVRIPGMGQTGFYITIGDNLNKINDITQDAMAEITQALSAMSSGDLTYCIEKEYEGIYDDLKQNTNKTIANLVHVLLDIQQCSSGVKQAADELAECNLSLNKRTEQQSNNLQATAISMDKMTETIKQNTESSKLASQLANNTRKVAEEGGDIVKQAIQAMGEISASSNKISDIISVIDEIAFQTNLLALNAAVEAARAGEQGRGFAVVAGEVRNLAGRSATAAKEIKNLIQDSVKKVDEGKNLVNRSGKSLINIVEAVKEVSEIVTVIAKASAEQSVGITEVNQAVMTMDGTTQQNATLVEEIASTCSILGFEATELVNKISFFKTPGTSKIPSFEDISDVSATASELNDAPENVNESDIAETSDDEWEAF